MPVGAVTATDGFALAMVAILTLSLGVVALLVLGIYRSGKQRESEVDTLLEELRRDEEAEKHPAAPGATETRDPWEKDPEWWRR
jgi:hypothetical protein